MSELPQEDEGVPVVAFKGAELKAQLEDVFGFNRGDSDDSDADEAPGLGERRALRVGIGAEAQAAEEALSKSNEVPAKGLARAVKDAQKAGKKRQRSALEGVGAELRAWGEAGSEDEADEDLAMQDKGSAVRKAKSRRLSGGVAQHPAVRAVASGADLSRGVAPEEQQGDRSLEVSGAKDKADKKREKKKAKKARQKAVEVQQQEEAAGVESSGKTKAGAGAGAKKKKESKAEKKEAAEADKKKKENKAEKKEVVEADKQKKEIKAAGAAKPEKQSEKAGEVDEEAGERPPKRYKRPKKRSKMKNRKKDNRPPGSWMKNANLDKLDAENKL